MKNIISILLIILIITGCTTDTKVTKDYFKIRDAYANQMEVVGEKFKTAITEKEQKALMKEMPDRKVYQDTLLYFINENPDKEFIADAWVEIYKLRWFVRNDSVIDHAITEIIHKHSKSSYLANLPPEMLTKSRNPKMPELMETVLKNNESKEVKGIMSLAFANWLTRSKAEPHFNLEKGLALYNDVIEKYSDITIKEDTDNSLVPIGNKAEGAKRRLTELAIGNKSPEIISKDLQGNEVKLSDYLGNVVMLDVWATWCGPCIKMIPHEREMVQRLVDSPFKLISISLDKDVETIERFHKKTPMPWTHWYNGEQGGILTQWNIYQYPTIIILDKKGIIKYRFDGAVSQEKLDNAINPLLEI